MAVVNLDTAARLDIICRRGDSFSLAVKFDSEINDKSNEPGATGIHVDDEWIMTVKQTLDSSTTEFDGDGEAFTITVANDKKTLNITNSAPNMATITSGLYVYDVQHSTGSRAATGSDDAIDGDVTTYLYGTFEVREDVTDNS